MRSIPLLILIAVVLAAACGGPREVPVTVIVVATATAAPTSTAPIVPTSTATMVPTSTATTVPSATPTTAPSATPAPAPGLTVDDVIEAWVAAGLEVEGVRPLTRDDYGMAPLLGSGVRFLIPSLCEDCGGRVFLVEDDEEREALASYFRDMSDISAMLFSWVYVRDRIVVQINGDLPDERAADYERVFESAR